MFRDGDSAAFDSQSASRYLPDDHVDDADGSPEPFEAEVQGFDADEGLAAAIMLREPDDVTEQAQDDDGSAWDTFIDAVHGLVDATRGLGHVHDAAVELGDLVTPYRAGRSRSDDPASVIPVLAVTRSFVAAVEDAGLSEDHLHRLAPLIDSLAHEVGADLAAADDAGPQAPVWLDVASPAHGDVNVSGVLTAFGKGHVTTADSASVVTANDCTLEAEDHYHLRRVSLDCRGLYDDEYAMAAFVHAMRDPSRSNISQLLERLGQLVGPRRDAEAQHHRHRLPARVTTRTERAAVVALGDGSTMHTTMNYHVRQAVVTLPELLLTHPGLIHDLATRRDGDRLGEPMLLALSQVEDPVLLRNATNLPSARTSVSHSLGGTRVRLANAVMVGYGNTLIATSKVERGRSKLLNLARFDRAVAKTRDEIYQHSDRKPGDAPYRQSRGHEEPPSCDVPPPSPVRQQLYVEATTHAAGPPGTQRPSGPASASKKEGHRP